MKSKLKLLLTILPCLLLGFSGKAQQDLSFSLKEAQDYAMTHSYVVQNSNIDVLKAQKKVWETIASGLPQVSGTGSYMSFLDLAVSLVPAEFFGGEPGTYMPVKFGQDYSSDYGFKVDQLIFDGSYIVGVSSAQIYLRLAQQSKEKTEIDIRNAVAQSYYMVLVAGENINVMKENLRNSEKLLSDTRSMYENGFVEEQDVEQMQLMVKRSENEVLKAERELKVAKIVLKYTMGVEMDKEIELSDLLETHLNPLVEKDPQGGAFDYSSHIDYRLLDTQKQASKKLLDLEKASYLPRLSAFYNWTKTAYGNEANLFKSDVSWFKSSYVGLNMSLPIFSGGMKKARVKQAKFDFEKAENNQKLAEQTLQKDYLSALADLQTAVSRYANDEDNRELAKKIYTKTTVKYNNGIVGSTELAQNESQFIQAQGTWIASVMQVLNAKISLNKAIGQ